MDKLIRDFVKTVPCGLCGTPTPMTSTERCDRCWELETRIKRDSQLAAKILAEEGSPSGDGGGL